MRSSLLRVDGLREARERVDLVGERARRPEPALRAPGVLLALQESERRRFSGSYRWRPITKEWRERKRREGLSTKTMVATGRLAAALGNAVSPVRRTVYNGTLTWGIRGGRTDLYYAQVQAHRGRRSVVIDRIARASIAERVQTFLAHGFIA